MLVKISSNLINKRTFRIPSSKPETQRAIMVSAMANGVSYIENDLRCFETSTMKDALRCIGVEIVEEPNRLRVHGVGKKFSTGKKIIMANGSGLVFRFMAALTSFSSSPTIIAGDKRLSERITAPFLEQLKVLGADIECISTPGQAPIVNWGKPLIGGQCDFYGNLSSQFISAIALVAPYSKLPTTINIHGPVLSKSYIYQTIQFMRKSGINIEKTNDELSQITVHPGDYCSENYFISGDYTSASYLILLAVLFEGTTILENMSPDSLQGEKEILDFVECLGINYEFDPASHKLNIYNTGLKKGGVFEFDTSNCPNIVPTLAALGSFIEGTFRVIGASITRFHKAPRVQAMVKELQKMGVDIQEIYKDGYCDGFEIIGKASYKGGVTLSDWNDHRVFMSLFIASMRCSDGNHISGSMDVDCSFPTFLSDMASLGVVMDSGN